MYYFDVLIVDEHCVLIIKIFCFVQVCQQTVHENVIV